MGRLIDADKLMLHLNDYALQEAPFGRNDGECQKEIYEIIQECMKAVEEQPTAFDVEKAVRELRELKMRYYLTIANTGDADKNCAYMNVANSIDEAIGTIETLSAKVKANNLHDGWIPCEERLPEDESYILVSFENCTMPDIARYEEDDEGGTFYPGDDEKSYLSYGLFVNAWMPLPEPYREDE